MGLDVEMQQKEKARAYVGLSCRSNEPAVQPSEVDVSTCNDAKLPRGTTKTCSCTAPMYDVWRVCAGMQSTLVFKERHRAKRQEKEGL